MDRQRLVTIACAVNRVNQFLIGQQFVQFTTELFDVAVDGAVGNDALILIHQIHQCCAGEDMAGPTVQGLQQ